MPSFFILDFNRMGVTVGRGGGEGGISVGAVDTRLTQSRFGIEVEA